MKNLKKILCLVLVVAMVASMFVANAAFTDQADIENDAAVAVLSEIEVLEGNPDGSFKPNDTLTRAQGAAIIARMLLGDKAEKQMAAGNPFDDVKSTDWHAGYIAYCVAEGIAAGYGNGKFGPNDTLTVAQFAKMLLNALGYESANEGFTGANWAGPVGSLANALGLVEGANTTFDAKCTRQVAAQLAMNTLKTTMVDYAQAGITVEGEGFKVTTGGSKAAAVTTGNVNGGVENDETNHATTLQFAEKYFTNLTGAKATNGAFGRPGDYVWSVNNNPIAVVTNEGLLVKTFNGTVSIGAMAEAVGANTVKALKRGAMSLQVWVDGNDVTSSYTDDISTIISDEYSKAGKAINDGSNYPTNKGVRTEVYMDKTTVYVVIINTYVAVADEYNETAETMDFEVYTSTTPATMTVNNEDIAVEGYEEDDFVLVTVDNDNGGTAVIRSVAAAKTVSGEIETYTTSADVALKSVTVGGKKYGYSAKCVATVSGNPNLLNANLVGTGVTLVLDANDDVITFAAAADADNYVYVAGIAAPNGTVTVTGAAAYTAALYFTDGTYEEVTVGDYYNNTGKIATPQGTNLGWHTYTVNAEGKYNLTLNAAADTTSLASVSVSSNAQMNVPTAKTVTNKTVFVVVDEEGDATVYTGYKAMGTVAVNTGKLAISAVTDIYNPNVARYVFVGPAAQGSDVTVTGSKTDKSTLVYVYDAAYATSVDANGTVYNTYSYVLVNGVKDTVNTTTALAAGLHYDVKVDPSTGYIVQTTAVTQSVQDEFVVATKTSNLDDSVAYADGILTLDGSNNYAMADEYTIILINDETYTTVSMNKLIKETENVANVVFTGVLDTEGEVIETLYVAVP